MVREEKVEGKRGDGIEWGRESERVERGGRSDGLRHMRESKKMQEEGRDGIAATHYCIRWVWVIMVQVGY